MSLKSSFNEAVQSVRRFFDRREISHLESQKSLAKAGYLMASGGYVCVVTQISPEEAKGIVESCDQRIAEIRQKHGWSPKP